MAPPTKNQKTPGKKQTTARSTKNSEKTVLPATAHAFLANIEDDSTAVNTITDEVANKLQIAATGMEIGFVKEHEPEGFEDQEPKSPVVVIPSDGEEAQLAEEDSDEDPMTKGVAILDNLKTLGVNVLEKEDDFSKPKNATVEIIPSSIIDGVRLIDNPEEGLMHFIISESAKLTAIDLGTILATISQNSASGTIITHEYTKDFNEIAKNLGATTSAQAKAIQDIIESDAKISKIVNPPVIKVIETKKPTQASLSPPNKKSKIEPSSIANKFMAALKKGVTLVPLAFGLPERLITMADIGMSQDQLENLITEKKPVNLMDLIHYIFIHSKLPLTLLSDYFVFLRIKIQFPIIKRFRDVDDNSILMKLCDYFALPGNISELFYEFFDEYYAIKKSGLSNFFLLYCLLIHCSHTR